MARLATEIEVKPGELATAVLPWAEFTQGGDVFVDKMWGPTGGDLCQAIIERGKKRKAVALQSHHDEPGIVPADVEPDDMKAIAKAWRENGPRVFETLRWEFAAPRFWQRKKWRLGALSSLDEKVRREAVDICKQIVDLLAWYNGEYKGRAYLLFWLAREGLYIRGGEADLARRKAQLLKSLSEIIEHNPEMVIGIEPKPHDPPCWATVTSYESVLALAADLDHPENLQVLVEIAHAILAGQNPAVVISELAAKKKLCGIHLNDQNGFMIDQDHPAGALNFHQLVEVFVQLRIHQWFDGWHYVGHDVKTTNGEAEEDREVGLEVSQANTEDAFIIAETIDLKAYEAEPSPTRRSRLLVEAVTRTLS